MSQAPGSPRRLAVIAFVALLASALAMGVSPVFVREAQVGPFTSAFYRVFLALPLLWAWSRLEHVSIGADRPDRRERAEGEGRSGADTPTDPGWTRGIVLAGFFFTVDLFCWHLSVLKTTMANATLLATMAPVWVMLFSLVIGERVTRMMVIGLCLCILGGAALVGSSLQVAPERLVGDLFGIGTSVGFGFYFLAIRVARRNASTGLVLFRSTVITSALLAIVAGVAENAWWPTGLTGVVALILMASVSHVGGQGLLAFALGHLSAAFSSLVIFLESLAAAFFGWLIFGETLGPLQIFGGLLILCGIWVARPRTSPDSA